MAITSEREFPQRVQQVLEERFRPLYSEQAAHAVLVFTGQGAKITDADKAFFDKSDIAQTTFKIANSVLALENPLETLCFDETMRDEFRRPSNAQPALFTLSMAKLLTLVDAYPEFSYGKVAGHSLGEYIGAVAAGALEWKDGLKLARRRGEILEENSQGQNGGIMIVGRITFEQAQEIADSSDLYISNINTLKPQKEQIGMSGNRDNFPCATKLMPSNGRVTIIGDIDYAPHCSFQTNARIRMEKETQSSGLVFYKPHATFYSNATTQGARTGEAVRHALSAQIDTVVNWVKEVNRIVKEGGTVFWEVGQGHNAINGLIETISPTSDTQHANEKIY